MVVIPFVGSSMVPLEAELPLEVEESDVEGRYVFVGKWQHFFDGRPTWSDIRWVFDREDWSVVFLEIQDAVTLEWVRGTREETSSVEVDMNENDSRFLDNVDEWGLSQSDEIPDWACTPVELHARSELTASERAVEDRRRNTVRLRLPEGPYVRAVSIRFARPRGDAA
ncbi:hypothetical protein [Aureimonas ureilytica]|uniref:hypothetical protein n=1 Tax=Aureimonas ureilytica TaxID=401562 RepID=UPI0003620F70|nr:hypothetical protein [Aureimonas ureilytica]